MIKTQKSFLPYTVDPVQLYRQLRERSGSVNTLLLESADVQTKAGQKSFLISKAALRLLATGDEVRVSALTELGIHLLEQLCGRETLVAKKRERDLVVFSIAESKNFESLSDQLKRESCLDVLRDIVALHEIAADADKEHFLCAGILAYDLIDHFENLPKAKADPHECPDYIFWFPEEIVEIDHVRKQMQIIQHYNGQVPEFGSVVSVLCDGLKGSVRHAKSKTGTISEQVTTDLSDAEYIALVEKLKEHVVAGDVFQIVPSRTFSLPCPDPLAAYEHLKAINPSPYMYYVVAEDFELLGASPETFIKLDAISRIVDVKPIAGTRKRGFTEGGKVDPELDSRLEAELRLDTKELAEHMMLVDLARNDIARVSKLGTRHVHRLLSVERYSHVMHLVSQVRGELRDDLDGLHAYQASLNMGTLVGAPKVKASELLRLNEKTKRGTYGGAIGYLDAAGNFDTAIIIRSAFVKNGTAFVRAGAGVVYDSDPVLEAAETRGKASAALTALSLALEERV